MLRLRMEFDLQHLSPDSQDRVRRDWVVVEGGLRMERGSTLCICTLKGVPAGHSLWPSFGERRTAREKMLDYWKDERKFRSRFLPWVIARAWMRLVDRGDPARRVDVDTTTVGWEMSDEAR